MSRGPLGATAFANEYGRPSLSGFFRAFEWHDEQRQRFWGYDKPLMLAGGIGHIDGVQVDKRADRAIANETCVVVLGGEGYKIGIGGGSASSVAGGANDAEVDFNSVQRANPVVQRRAQDVIDACVAMGENNPIIFIHDVGAGGLSNAVPELLHDLGMGGVINLDAIPIGDVSMTASEIWCNESQERYVMAINPEYIDDFQKLCDRFQVTGQVIGKVQAQKEPTLIVNSKRLSPDAPVIDLPMSVLFDCPEVYQLGVEQGSTSDQVESSQESSAWDNIDIKDLCERIIEHPTVASKEFLITIGDRTVGGLTVRDQLIGPMQVPVADCQITSIDYTSDNGVAVAIGEKPTLALRHPDQASRMAVAEMITNIASAEVKTTEQIRMSANWMAAMGISDEEDEQLYQAVKALSEFCCELGIAVPVGKDSLSMRSDYWEQQGSWKGGADRSDIRRKITNQQVVSPVTLVASGMAAVESTKHLTPQLQTTDPGVLVLLESDQYMHGAEPMAGSIADFLADKVCTEHTACSGAMPDVTAEEMTSLLAVLQEYRQSIQAYHDRSDGGLFTTLAEMAFTVRTGLNVNLPEGVRSNSAIVRWLTNECWGVVLQVPSDKVECMRKYVAGSGLRLTQVAEITGGENGNAVLSVGDQLTWNLFPEYRYGKQGELDTMLEEARQTERWLYDAWTSSSDYVRRVRGEHLDVVRNRKINALLTDRSQLQKPSLIEPAISTPQHQKVKVVGIVREQGTNGAREMAAAFMAAGFECKDIHSTDLKDAADDEKRLDDILNVDVLAFCGGFSYGDVLGAGRGWSQSLQATDTLKTALQKFFADKSKLVLGVCNGCQALSQLRHLFPPTNNDEEFTREIIADNDSGVFEARLTNVTIANQESPWLANMQNETLLIASSHGEGRFQSAIGGDIALRYSNSHYPINPNGSKDDIAGITFGDGRILLMMPHPERVFLKRQLSWGGDYSGNDISDDSGNADNPYSGWMQMFYNAAEYEYEQPVNDE